MVFCIVMLYYTRWWPKPIYMPTNNIHIQSYSSWLNLTVTLSLFRWGRLRPLVQSYKYFRFHRAQVQTGITLMFNQQLFLNTIPKMRGKYTFIFSKKFILSFNKHALNCIKSNSTVYKCYKNVHFKYILNFLLIKESEKICITICFHQKYYPAQLFLPLIMIIKCHLSSKSAYHNDFWRIMWHWRLE